MEPQLPQVNVQPEGQPISPVVSERVVGVKEKTPEALIQSPEVMKNTEKSNTDNLGQPTPILTNTVQTDNSVPRQDQTTNSDNGPAAASDSDIIEKEWITKAKSIVSKTSDNPHKQQHEVSKLMVDYVLKRYGRKIGENNG